MPQQAGFTPDALALPAKNIKATALIAAIAAVLVIIGAAAQPRRRSRPAAASPTALANPLLRRSTQ